MSQIAFIFPGQGAVTLAWERIFTKTTVQAVLFMIKPVKLRT